ncbi:FAD binding domain-containing protein [Pseudooceanicola sp. LIPI14-2-Ac024]|uniref:FAD binding domain-containing protein n=1 Tax=Pseudooceanicola sp. LIPI14-2-Ac024 TaxID=3344875 RepID=UPI0035D024AF
MKDMTDSPAVEWRAAGTDLSERRRSGVSRGPVRDLVPTAEMRGIAKAGGGLRLGASATIAEIAGDPRIVAGYPGLAVTAGGLATPQIRQVATLGGNLAQRTRCWYYRNPEFACLKSGGTSCPAREGNHRYGVAFDLGPCVAPHPSSVAAALMAYEATVTTDRRAGIGVAALLGDGSDGSADNTLQPGETILHVDLPPAVEGERAGYRRAISRSFAEWPLAEVVVRVVVVDGAFRMLRLAAGGVAPVPLRLTAAEAVGEGAPATPETIAAIAAAACEGANPLPMTGYKIALLDGLLRDVIESCVAG